MSEQLAKSYKNPMEDLGKQLASSLALSGMANFKHPLADMKVPNALTVFSEQLAKSYKNPMEDLGKQLASSLALSGMANFKHPLADMKVPNALTVFSEQLANSYKNPMEDLGKQLASSLALSGMANFKHPLADMKVPNALTVFSEQLANSYKNPMEDLGKQLASSLALSGMANFKHPLADILGNPRISGLSSAWLTEFENSGADGLVASLREDLAVDPSLAQEVEEIFERIGAPEDLLDETADFLNLTVPFGYDAAVRAGLQVLAVTSLYAVLLIIFLNNPVLGAVLSAGGTPNVAASWKATGNAYDRLYGTDAKPKLVSKDRKRKKSGPLAKKNSRNRTSRW
ncbi:hypothetical protein [Pseudarthrobacter siccitolerans]|uniref:hypothetical protein n=1 Tax=Pseudarthrobacter siccitolerans TaxID=861266 RepID=UPI0027BACB91|nr:hypothetical protein [Pseudarthrobacter siccitolerans]